MEVNIKEMFSDASKFDTELQEHGSTHCVRNPLHCTQHGRDVPLDNSQQLCTMTADTTDDVDQDRICCIVCAISFSITEAFANHVSMEHHEAYANGCSGMWIEEQTHINYYDAFQTVKIEINENEDKAEIKEDVFSSKLSNMMSSYSENIDVDTVGLNTSLQLKREEIDYAAPFGKETETKENCNINYEEQKKGSVKLQSETIHELTHSEKKSFACHICDYKCRQKGHLRDHMGVHTDEKPFVCHICDYKFSCKRSLIRHMRTHTGEKPFACHICTYKCNRNSDLKRHVKTHIAYKPFACHICDYRCSCQNRLRLHIRMHTGEKPFACHICDYKCYRNSDFKRHSRIHTGEKPFACHICDYKCNRNSVLKNHIRTHTTDKQFTCHICDYKCNQTSDLKLHIRTHTRDKPFTCDICNYKCSRKSTLRLHIRTHTGEKPFTCHICDYKCNQKSDLKIHIRTHWRQTTCLSHL